MNSWMLLRTGITIQYNTHVIILFFHHTFKEVNKMENRVLLIDGNSILHRAFYGYPEYLGKDGTPLQGVFGFINIINKHIHEACPSHIGISFDMPFPTFRHTMYKEYKGTRKDAPPGIGQSFAPLQKLLSLMKLKWVSVPGYEGDDILGTLSRKFLDNGFDVDILSGDKDTFQLICDGVSIRFPKTIAGTKNTLVYDASAFEKEYGLKPIQFIDMKALMGDTSDNIPGVKGIGPKMAQKIIQAYGSIEEAYAEADKIKPAKYGELLTDQYDQAVFSKKLATIVTDVPLKFNADEYKVQDFWCKEAVNYLDELAIKDKIWMN